MIRLELTDQQTTNLAGLLDIASRTIGGGLANNGLRALDDAITKLSDARELGELLNTAMQPKPKKGKAHAPDPA